MPVRMSGATSGYVELAAPAVAGTTVLELPTDSIKPGLVLVAASSFSAVSSVSVDDCFTSEYDNYRVIVQTTAASSDGNTNMRLRAASTDASGSDYVWQQVLVQSATVAGAGSGGLVAQWRWDDHDISVTPTPTLAFDVISPGLAAKTLFTGAEVGVASNATFGFIFRSGYHNLTTAYDGLTLLASSGTITGSIYVYGYRKAL